MSSDGAEAKSCQKLIVKGLHPEIEWQVEQIFAGFGYLCDVMPSSDKDDYSGVRRIKKIIQFSVTIIQQL